ncbi:unnamed protein product [Allacma fusca]|uniref:Malonyl-CoA:ACP transacylase (MAT) domain-containing protein n=1 Tax=Allacma fusca TaxID=39272 RepID=A0A8J2JH12_9HEXA|nr:unnamed protein product [Allacma fusca]
MTDSGRKYAALNSIVNDGTNVHIILEFPRKEPAQLVLPPIPVFVPISGRTSPGVEYQMKRIVTGVKNQHLVGLLHEAYKIKIPQHPFRGYVLSSRTESKQNIGNRLPRSKSPLWFIFTGLGNQWVGMTKDMVKFKTFNDSIHKSAKILKEKENYDLLQVLESTDPAYLDDFKNSIAAITSVQIALMDLFNVIGIQPDGIVGYSTGECCSGYADGCFSHEQSLLVSFSRARAFTESNLPPGSVAAVGLSWDQAKRRCPRGIYPAIHNSESLVSISGPPGDVQKFTAKLKSENIFAQEVKSAIYGFHSPLVAGSEKLMRELLGKIITEPKPRSKKWISTSILAEKWDSELAKYSSVDYHVNNALSPVFFYVTLKHIPISSVVVEIGPHGFLQSIIKQGAFGSALVVALMDQKSNDNTKFYLDSLGKLYLHGVDLDAGKLYEPVQFPVQSGTPSLSPMIKWDHTRSWSVPQIKN